MSWPWKIARTENDTGVRAGRSRGPREQPSPEGSAVGRHLLCQCGQHVCKVGAYELHMYMLGARLVGLVGGDPSEGNLMLRRHTPPPHRFSPGAWRPCHQSWVSQGVRSPCAGLVGHGPFTNLPLLLECRLSENLILQCAVLIHNSLEYLLK